MDYCLLVVRLHHLPVLAVADKYHDDNTDPLLERHHVWNYRIPHYQRSRGRSEAQQFCSVAAPNNGPTWSQKNQNCLNTINNTPDGKFYNFFSPLSMFPGIGPDWKGSIAEDAGGGAAKFAAYKFFQGASQTMVRTPFGSMSGFVADSIEGVAEGVLAPVAAAATVGQLTVHAGCAISAAF